VQLLAIRANFRIRAINAYDWRLGRCIYRALEGEVQEVYNGHRMLYLPYISFMPLSYFIYCKKFKPFTFMLSCVGRNGRFGTHRTIWDSRGLWILVLGGFHSR
jgi:hypothetical protein